MTKTGVFFQGIRRFAPAPLHCALRPVHAGHRAARHEGPDHQEHAPHQPGGQDPHGGHAQSVTGGHRKGAFAVEELE